MTVVIATLIQCGFWGNRFAIFLTNQLIEKQGTTEGEKNLSPLL